MSDEYVAILVKRFPAIKEVWLIGSRANESARADSDWDYIVFADERTLSLLRCDESLRRPDIDVLMVFDGDSFEEPWPTAHRKKHGSLHGWGWRRLAMKKAVYRATKVKPDDEFNVTVASQYARRVWP
jgi:hypothetical protein